MLKSNSDLLENEITSRLQTSLEKLRDDALIQAEPKLIAGLFFDLLDFPYDSRTKGFTDVQVARVLGFHLITVFRCCNALTSRVDKKQCVVFLTENVQRLDFVV